MPTLGAYPATIYGLGHDQVHPLAYPAPRPLWLQGTTNCNTALAPLGFRAPGPVNKRPLNERTLQRPADLATTKSTRWRTLHPAPHNYRPQPLSYSAMPTVLQGIKPYKYSALQAGVPCNGFRAPLKGPQVSVPCTAADLQRFVHCSYSASPAVFLLKATYPVTAGFSHSNFRPQNFRRTLHPTLQNSWPRAPQATGGPV